jgi:hypothetical protein
MRKPKDIHAELIKAAYGNPIHIPKYGLFMDIGRVTLEQNHFIDNIRALEVLDSYFGFTKEQEQLKVIGTQFNRSGGWAHKVIRKVIRGYIRELRQRERDK